MIKTSLPDNVPDLFQPAEISFYFLFICLVLRIYRYILFMNFKYEIKIVYY